MKELFPSLYRNDSRETFGPHFVAGPDFVHGQWQLVARFEPTGDGQPVEIDEIRMPARFYRLRALGGKNSVGDPVPAFTLSTGSGKAMAKLMLDLAKAISEGMVGVDP